MSDKNHEMITLEEINKVWGSANFGGEITRMEVVMLGVLKCASGYYQGYTSTTIITELGLVTRKYNLTKRGKYCMWEYFSKGSNL